MVLIVAVAGRFGLAQQPAPDKHVKDIRAEQPFEVISASPLCQRVRAEDRSAIHQREINPATLETDLPSLMQKSDEVVLASNRTDQLEALSPSGSDAVEYLDVKVLRSFKGSHKVGDLLTFAIPHGAISCGSEPGNDRPSMAVLTLTGGFHWKQRSISGPSVLFLRQSRGDEKQLTPGLRLTAGDGMQGLFIVHANQVRSDFDTDCSAVLPGGLERCIARLDASQETVKLQYGLDPLTKRYEGMPVPSFLKEVKSVADSLGYSGEVSAAK